MESILEKWQCSLGLRGQNILQEFSKHRNDFDMARFVLELYQTSPPKIFVNSKGKNAELSNKFRELGNVQFKGKALALASKLYTKSLAYAPVNSKEYVLALGNRSACSIAMENPICALSDVSRALAVEGLDSAYEEKLKNRKEKCEKNVSNSVQKSSTHITLPTLSSQNEYLSCASKKVELAVNESVGRHLKINDRAVTGEVLMIEEPFASVLILDCFYTNCNSCYKYCLNLLPCKNCTISLYCSVRCLERSKQVHELECEVFERLTQLDLGKMDFLALRILLVASEGGRTLNELKTKLYNRGEPEKYQSLDFFRVYDLVGNTEKRSYVDLLRRTFTACTIVSALSSFSNFFQCCPGLESFAAAILLRFLQNLPCNAHEVSEFHDGQLTEVAAAVYATFSLLNHSCDPNVVRQSFGNIVVLRAIRDIKVGEELVDNYGYHYATHNLQQRQSGLKQYYFTCECVACRNNWPLYRDLPSDEPVFKTGNASVRSLYNKLTSEFEEKLQLVIDNKVTIEVMDFLCEYLSFLEENILRPWQDYNKCQEAIKYGFNFFPDYSRADN